VTCKLKAEIRTLTILHHIFYQALSNLLGDKDFFFGNKTHTLDCTVFGHLSQFIYIPMAFPQQIYIRKNCENLLKFVDRMKDTHWPDWEEMCSTRCMKGHLGKDKKKLEFIE
jgi:glutathione S-transferase